VPLNLADKKALVAEMGEIVNSSISAVVADYRGLTVAEMTRLRVVAREKGVVVRVFRNTLARRAVQETAFACLTEALVGPVILLFSQHEPGAAAKLVRDFIKECEKFEVKALALDGSLLGPEQLKAVASLPSYDEAVAQLMSVMIAPVTKLARTTSETVAQVVRVISAVGDKKKAA